MQVLLIGGFDIARTLAASLLTQKYQVTAIHPDYDCCKQLADIKGLQVIHGDGRVSIAEVSIPEGAPLASCMFEFASSLGTVGLSIGLTGPTTRAATLMVEIAGMLLGRLEIFLVFTGLGSAVRLMRQRRCR